MFGKFAELNSGLELVGLRTDKASTEQTGHLTSRFFGFGSNRRVPSNRRGFQEAQK